MLLYKKLLLMTFGTSLVDAVRRAVKYKYSPFRIKKKSGDPETGLQFDMTYSQRAGYCTSRVLDRIYGAVQFEPWLANQLQFYVTFLKTPPDKYQGSTSIKPRLLPSNYFSNLLS